MNDLLALLLKNIIGLIIVRCNERFGRVALPLANIALATLRRNVKFKSREDLGPEIIEVREGGHNTSSARKHFFHLYSRIHIYLMGIKSKGMSLGESYCLDQIQFEDNDTILDVGANSGDLVIFFEMVGVPIRLYSFEPDPVAFKALKANAAQRGAWFKPLQLALSNNAERAPLYLSSLGGDTSLSKPATYDDVITIETNTLDLWWSKLESNKTRQNRIKLLKLEAEGFEPEILDGASVVLQKVDYIAADLGWERGEAQDTTIPQVVNKLLSIGFNIKAVSKDGVHFLFERKF